MEDVRWDVLRLHKKGSGKNNSGPISGSSTRLIRSYSTKTHPQGKEVGTLLVHHSDDENDEWSAFASSN